MHTFGKRLSTSKTVFNEVGGVALGEGGMDR